MNDSGECQQHGLNRLEIVVCSPASESLDSGA